MNVIKDKASSKMVLQIIENNNLRLFQITIDKEYALKKGRLPEKDYEIIVPQSMSSELALNKECDVKVNGKKLKVVGYYIAEVVIYGNPLAPVASIPGNLVQIGVAAVITLVVIAPLNVAAKRTGLKK